MAHGTHDAHDAKAHEKHYIKIFVWLLVLLVISVVGVEVVDWIGLEGLTRLAVVLAAAFGIALVKAWLVVKHFMHVNVEPKYVGYICTTSLLFMGLLFFFVAPDVMKHEGTNWVNVSAQAAAAGAVTSTPSGEFDAHTSFETVCAACHGAEGRGDGAAASALNPRPANFQHESFWQTRTRESIVTVIRDGGPAIGKSPLMAAFRSAFTEEQIEELADVVMSFRPEQVAEPTPDAPVPAPVMPYPDHEVTGSQTLEIAEGVVGEPVEATSADDPSAQSAAEEAASERRRVDFIRRRLGHGSHL